MDDDADAQAKGQAPGSLSPAGQGYWLWYAKQPTLNFVPIGVYRLPPPADAEGNIGAVFLGDDEGTEVAGFPVGYLAWRTTRAEGWIRRHLTSLVP